MAQLHAIVQYLSHLLDPTAFQDSAYNGLQVESDRLEVECVALAVDAGLSVIEDAIRQQAQLLIVHHGLLWRDREPIVGAFGRKVRTLLQGGCSLYASHLPLDAHPLVGNNAELARLFDLPEFEPFCAHGSVSIGVKAYCPEPRPLETFVSRARDLIGAREPVLLSFGNPLIRQVGIVSGAASFAIQSAADEGLDLLLTGEPRHEAYHSAKELGLNVLFAGHYATETVGVLALKTELEKEFGISTVFVHEATGI